MRRLTLILSDLYLPADAVRESFPTTLDLPALEWLLRFAQSRRIDDWRSWLARELGAAALADWPVAHVVAQAAGLPADGAWMATPVALEARLDHVRLRDRGLLHVPLDQQQALQAEFAGLFGNALSLHAAGRPSLLLSGGPQADVATRDPARLLDSDIGGALPGGSAAAGELRRLGAEIEMWLYSSPLNAAREKAGQKRIAALWLWGGGPARGAESPARGLRRFRLYGSDAYHGSLQHWIDGAALQPVPPGFADADDELPTFIELAPMSGRASETLPELERNWFAPARNALQSGSLGSLQLVANDRVFESSARSGWKFWRRRRGWLESLA
jgi:hypothetical protein